MESTTALMAFRKLAKADEEQSLINDITVLFDPVLLVGVGFAIVVAFSIGHDNKTPHLPYPSYKLISVLVALFGILYSIGFDLRIYPVSLWDPNGGNDTQINDSNLQSSTPSSSLIYYNHNNSKPYTNYSVFYKEAYLDGHVITSSRRFHFVLASSVVAIWVMYDTRLMVASLTALLVGATSTIPLASCNLPFLEMSLVFVVGIIVSRVSYGTMPMVRWLLFFSVWTLLDYLDHHFLGHNGSVAIYMGQHYLSWALIGQLQLATGMLLEAKLFVANSAMSRVGFAQISRVFTCRKNQ